MLGNFILWSNSNLSSASALNLNQSKLLSFSSKELRMGDEFLALNVKVSFASV